MTDTQRFIRRNRVDERWALLIASIAGLVAVLSGAEPTGATVPDAVFLFAIAGLVTWASASAPWWASAAAAGIGAAIALDPVIAAVGLVGLIAGLAIGVRQRDQSELRAIVGGLAINVLLRSELEGFHGLSAIIGIATAGTLLIVGLRRRPSAIRRVAYLGLGAVAGVGTLTLLALAAVGVSARSDVSTGTERARQAIDTLNNGDYERAADLFAEASGAFERADDRLGGVLAVPSRLVPGVAQNVTAGADLSAAAASGTADAAAALRSIDASTLQVVEGAIDLTAVAAVEEPLLRVQQALIDLRDASESVESPWLIAPVQDALAELDERLDANEPRLANAIDAVRLAPDLLGASGERRYLVLFTSPAEARGITGFIGNYAEIVVDGGAIDVVEFGRRSDLEDVVAAEGAACPDLPEEMLVRYGRFGLTNGPDGTAGPRVWSNLTMPAHYPYIAEAASCLYPQSGGRPVDGVIALDPYVVQALMTYTGPIEVPELDVTVTPQNAADFIMNGQYLAAGDGDQTDRIDALETLGEEVIGRLLGGTLPEPATLGRDLGPLAAEDRLLVWTPDPAEQDLFQRIGMLGAMPDPAQPGFAVFVGNAGQSKIDVYLERETEVRIETDDDGQRRLIADVTLTNNAPSSGLPDYVIGNSFDLPHGSSRLNLSFYAPSMLEVIERDGEPVDVSPMIEVGWSVYGVEGVIGPGQTANYHLEFPLSSSSAQSGVTEWCQPLSTRDC